MDMFTAKGVILKVRKVIYPCKSHLFAHSRQLQLEIKKMANFNMINYYKKDKSNHSKYQSSGLTLERLKSN